MKLATLLGTMFCLFSMWAVDLSAAPRAKSIEFWKDYEPGSQLHIDHAKWDALLKKHLVTNHESGINRVDYAQFSDSDKASLAEYLEYLQIMDPRQLSRDGQKAFWLNLYNAGIVSLILEEGVEESIRDLGRVWKKKRFYISMQNTSFDDIQHGVLRPMFGDNRVLLAINAGTLGSASMRSDAFTAKNIDSMLDAVVTDFLAHPNGLQLDGDTLILSRTFKWYARDFGNRDELIEFISRFVSEETARAIQQVKSIKYQYDWTLNKP